MYPKWLNDRPYLATLSIEHAQAGKELHGASRGAPQLRNCRIACSGLPQDGAVYAGDLVGSDNHAARKTPDHSPRLGLCEACDQVLRLLTGPWRFVSVRRHRVEGEAKASEQFAPER